MSIKKNATCTICEAMCGITLEISDAKQIERITGDKLDPYSMGYICPKAQFLQTWQHSPSRLKRPMKKVYKNKDDATKRVNGEFVAISWKEAYAIVEKKLTAIRKTLGNDAIGLYQGNPNVHNLGTLLYGPRFARKLRTKNKFSASSVDQLPHHLVAHQLYGHQLAIPVPDVTRADMMIIMGANPLESNGSLMGVPGFQKVMLVAKKRGAKIIVIDPRRTKTAKLADRHHFIHPESDIFLLLGMLKVIFEQNLANARWNGVSEEDTVKCRELVKDISLEECAKRTKMEVKDILKLAISFANAKSGFIYGRFG
ncbi:molybdopterin-dependent oxidoreductase, partial [Bacteriovoracaceae bacterium]|nr:molybdopterin-dependent oxidoreductase [Bacteriovoracaceae bacterium]